MRNQFVRWNMMAAAAMGLMANAAMATSITLYPGDLGSTNVVGSPNAAPGFPNSSWQADTTVASTADNKSELYIPVAALFSGPVTVGDLASISYFTNKPGDAGSPDWTFLIYTAKQAGDSSFYHSRLNSEPYLTGTSDADDPANAWHQWSTDGSDPMRFYDANRDGGVYGTYTDPTLAQLTAGPVTWNGSGENGTSHDYSGEDISYFSLQTGSAWADGFTGLLDGLQIKLTDGQVGTVNFESATPLPSAAWGGLVLCGMIGMTGGAKRLRRSASI